MVGNLLGVLDSAAVFQVGGDARRPEGMGRAKGAFVTLLVS